MPESSQTMDSVLDHTNGNVTAGPKDGGSGIFTIQAHAGPVSGNTASGATEGSPQSYVHQSGSPGQGKGPVLTAPGTSVALGGLPNGEDSDSVSTTSETAVLIPEGLEKTTDIHTASLAAQGDIRCRHNSVSTEGDLGPEDGKPGSGKRRPWRSCWSRWVKSGHCFLCSMGLVVFLGCSALAMYFLLEPFLRQQIRQNLVLRDSLTKWAKPDEKPAFSITLFDITNADDVLSQKAPLKLREVGPFVYRLSVEKVNLTWNDNGTVSFRERVYFHPDLELTKGSLDENITTVNLPLAGLLSQAGSFITSMMVDKSENIFETRTVKELLWGYHSDVLKKIGSIGHFDVMHLIPDLHISPIFSLLKDQNGTDGPLMNVYTGAGDFSKLGKIHAMDYSETLKYWATKEANEIRGTDGSMFQPFLEENKDLTMLYGQLFRTFDLEYQKPVDHSGVHCFRYIVGDSQFETDKLMRGKLDNGPDYQDYVTDSHAKEDASHEDLESVDLTFDKDDIRNPRTAGDEKATSSEDLSTHDVPSSDSYEDNDEEEIGGYCTPECLPHGAYSIKSASKGVPMMVSLPHFLGADPVYTEHVEGLQANEAEHRSIFDVDKLTGVLINNHRRHQINIEIDDSRLSTKYIPLFWNDITVKLTDENMSDLKLATTVAHVIKESRIYLLAFSMFCVGILLVASTANCVRRRRHRSSYTLGKPKGYVVV